MIIRATQQLYRLSGIPPVKNTDEPALPFPGDWYASQVGRFDGSYTAIHFLHNPTRISVLVPGTFQDSAIPVMRDRIEDLEFEDIFRTGKELKNHYHTCENSVRTHIETTMKKERTLRLNKDFIPCDAYENEEIYPNGIFHFNISRISEHIISGQLIVQQEDVRIPDWFKSHGGGCIKEEHLKTVNLEKPVIQAEISPGNYNIIDGNHRLEKAHREKVETVKSYKLKAEQLIPYFITVRGYQAFVGYWNNKLSDLK